MSEAITEKGKSRRGFLVKMGLGAAALAAISTGLLRFGGSGKAEAAGQEFPEEESIFHPAQDPRSDPRRV